MQTTETKLAVQWKLEFKISIYLSILSQSLSAYIYLFIYLSTYLSSISIYDGLNNPHMPLYNALLLRACQA